MWIFPVLLDSRPEFAPAGGSLLLAPLGRGSLLDRVRASVSLISRAPPVVVSRFPADATYERAIREICPDVERVETVTSFAGHYRSYGASDWLLFADAASLPLDARDPALLELAQDGDSRSVRHVVTLGGAGNGGTRELVETDAAGHVQGIRRYYDSVTWPLASGVSCSLVPVTCLWLLEGLPFTSLSALRHALAARGVSSADLPLRNGAVDLGAERGLLALHEHLLLELERATERRPAPGAPLVAGKGSSVHPTARLVGPVVVQQDAVVEPGATIVGPTVLGPGSRVGRDALVAQSLIGRGVEVAAGSTVRQRALLRGSALEAGPGEAGAAPPAAVPEVAWEMDPADLETELPPSSFYAPVKRAVDFVAALAALTLLAPLGLVIAGLIKLSSPGPVFFGHWREGRDARPFRCWKFRTMGVGADAQQRALARENEVDGPQFKVERDPRRTRIGRLLSETTLDELPQLFNVLVGEMSLVGPRPSPFRENQLCIPWREARLSVRPGVTGLWQVCRHDRGRGDFHQWIYFDMLYVRNVSLGLDLKVLLATPLSLGLRRPAPIHWLLRPDSYHERRSAPRG